MAFHDNLGGVIDASVLSGYFDYGVGQTKTLKMLAADGTNYGIGSPSNPTPISGTGAYASSFSGGYDFTSIDFIELQNADPDEHVVEFGVTALSTRDYGNVRVEGRLYDGGTMSATRHISEGNALGDTFYGFTAPAGNYFTGFSLSYDGSIVSPVQLCFDDIGFRTAKVGQERLQQQPVFDAEAEYISPGSWTISESESSIPVKRFSGIGIESRGIVEFDISSLNVGDSIQSAMLELDVGSFTHNSSGEYPILEVYGYAADGVASPSDATEMSILLSTSVPVINTREMAISLDTDALESLAGNDYVGLLLRQKVDGRNMSFSAEEFSSYAMAPTLTLDYTPDSVAEERSVEVSLDAKAEYQSGVGFVVTDGELNVNVYKYDYAGIDRRGILEFYVDELEANEEIISARLDLNIGTTTGTPTSQVYAYEGDGTIVPSDAEKTAYLAGTSEAIQGLGPHSIDLDPDVLVARIEENPWLGLLLVGVDGQTGFDTLENYLSTPATLVLEIVSHLPGDANRDGKVDAEDASILADNWLSSNDVSWGEGDFNGDGVVDATDATILAANWNSPTSNNTTVPEPQTLVLLLSTAVLLLIRRQ